MFKTEQEARANLSKTMKELNELFKSMEDAGMMKAEDPAEAEGQEGADAGGAPDALAAPGGEPGAEAPGAEAAPEAPAPEMGGDEGAGDQAGAAPGAEAPGAEGGDMEGAMRQQAGELDDQELEMMCKILQEEQAKRHEAGQQAQGGAGEMAMSMKKELASMAKSFKDEMAKLTKSFKGEVDALRAENAKLKSRPTGTPAATSAKTAPKVLDKKTPEAKPLTKSYAMDHLMGKMRSKDRGGVKADHVALMNACRNEDDVQQAVAMLKDEGIEIPAPK